MGAKTNRGNRVTQMLKGASGAPKGQEPVDPIMKIDGAVRNYLAELVRNSLQANRHEQLHELLTEHRRFIDEIIVLLESQGGS